MRIINSQVASKFTKVYDASHVVVLKHVKKLIGYLVNSLTWICHQIFSGRACVVSDCLYYKRNLVLKKTGYS